MRISIILLMSVALLGTEAHAKNNKKDKNRNHPHHTKNSLDKYPGFSGFTDENTTIYIKEARARERIVKNCMRRQGHKYFAVPLGGKEKLIAKVHQRNAEYMDTLSVEELAEYNLTLTGFEDPNDTSAGPALDESCVGRAADIIPGIFSIKAATNKVFGAKMREVVDRPEVVAKHDDWRQCMIGKNYLYATSPTEFMQNASLAFITATTPEAIEAAQIELDESRNAATHCSHSSGLAAQFQKSKLIAQEEFVQENKAALEAALYRYKGQPKIK